MIFENSHAQVYLAAGHTDMRKSIDGLAVLVKEGFNLDPFLPCLYVFCNRKRDKLKILKWECNGFWLYYRAGESHPHPLTDPDVRLSPHPALTV